MIKAELVMAMDFSHDRHRTVETYSYRMNGQWYIASGGPTYGNVFMVVECDAEGERLLIDKEVR